jgi:hypothetical protein
LLLFSFFLSFFLGRSYYLCMHSVYVCNCWLIILFLIYRNVYCSQTENFTWPPYSCFTFYKTVTLIKVAHFIILRPYIKWCWCCFHHIVITDCGKFEKVWGWVASSGITFLQNFVKVVWFRSCEGEICRQHDHLISLPFHLRKGSRLKACLKQNLN